MRTAIAMTHSETPQSEVLSQPIWESAEHQGNELTYYVDEGISPVHQDISDLKRHFEIRQNLYRMLGLPPGFFKGRRILEMAPGSGHNSLYLASREPASLDLVEPNPTAQRDIRNLYAELTFSHTTPALISRKLEEFFPDDPYDVAICEGWLGGNHYELGLLRRLSEMVAVDGVLVFTFMPPIAAGAALLRRLLAQRLTDPEAGLERNTEVLLEAFSPHLSTLAQMSRFKDHWVQDNLLNPHVYPGLLTPRWAFDTIGPAFRVMGSVPRIITDWRWYKSLHGDATGDNQRFLDDLDTVSHNLIDFRMKGTPRETHLNHRLERLLLDLAKAAHDHEAGGNGPFKKHIAPLLSEIAKNLGDDAPMAARAITEAGQLLAEAVVSTADIADMRDFAPLFGRDQCFLAMTKSG